MTLERSFSGKFIKIIISRYASCLGQDTRHCTDDEADVSDQQALFLGTAISGQTATIIMTAFFAIIIVLTLIVVLIILAFVFRHKPRNQKLEQSKL